MPYFLSIIIYSKKKHKMKTVFTRTATVVLFTLSMNNAIAQTNTFPVTGSAGIGTITPSASALLDITSTTKGMLMPRMTLTQRNAIVTPATGLMIYQTNSTPGFYYYSGTAWVAVTVKSKGWSITGNAGTGSINFIGTTDAQPLLFKINNQKAGYLDYASPASTSFGYQALHVNTGINNTANGYQTLYANTSGFNNVANGYQALYSNTAGNSNTANGVNALYTNTTGAYNTATGFEALFLNTTGGANTATGFQALLSSTIGYNNTANGFQALDSNTSGYSNTAMGYEALLRNKTGYENVAIGNLSQSGVAGSSGYDNVSVGNLSMNGITTGNSNTGIGNGALGGITTGSLNIGIGAGANDGLRKGNENVSIGFWAGRTNDSANYSVAIGSKAAYYNRRDYTTAVGYQALYYNSYGSSNINEGAANTAIGYRALYSNTIGNWNTATGFYALLNNSSGNYNTATGYYALLFNTTGSENTANGLGALNLNTTGSENTAVGNDALYNNSTGADNTAVGDYSLQANTTQGGLTAIGFGALESNNTGTQNTATGSQALTSNTGGSSNTANGYQALAYNTTGNSNTANGYKSLVSNTGGSSNTATGYQALNSNTTGHSNTADGYLALNSNTIGYYNTANGIVALFSNTSGIGNTATGYAALNDNSTGYYNTAGGQGAIYNNTTGQGNTAFGYGADVTAGNFTNAMSLGFFTSVNASNKVEVGNTSVTSIGGNVGWTSFSDGRYKQNIKQNVPGLEFINKLNPVTYTLDANAIETKLHSNQNDLKTPDGNSLPNPMNDPEMKQALQEKSKIVYTGFIAQDVEKAAQSLNYNFSGIDKPKDDQQSFYGLRYSDFVVPLVKAVQELSKQSERILAENDSLKTTNQSQQEMISALITRVDKLEQSITTIQQCSPCNASDANAQTYNTVITDGALLQQNVPNPFSHRTTLGYILPQKFTTAQIMITDKSGKTLKLVNVSGSGKGSLNVDASVLASGAYNYSLFVDGKLIGTKQMVLNR